MSFPVGRALGCLDTSLPAVGHGLIPDFAPEGVVGQPFHLFGQPMGKEPFDGLHNSSMESTSSPMQETPIGHLMGQGMLEGVF